METIKKHKKLYHITEEVQSPNKIIDGLPKSVILPGTSSAGSAP